MLFSLAFVMTLSPVVVGRADNQEWPAKGADVYISASIEYEGRSSGSQFSGIGTTTTIYTARPCTRLTMLQVQSDKVPWILRPYSNESSLNSLSVSSGFAKPLVVAEVRLQGPWRPRMFTTEAECLEHFAAAGEPKTTRKGPMLVIQSGG